MQMKTKLLMITAMFVMAMAMASTPVSAKEPKLKDCIDYHFVYNDGHEDVGQHCDGKELDRDADEDDKKYADIHVKTLHISCSDEFENGEGQKSDLDGHTVVNWLIIKYDKDGEEKERCGPGIPEDEIDCADLDLQAEALDGGSIKLTMNALAGADEYRIWREVNGGGLNPLATAPASTTEYLDTDTVIGSQYHYAVQIVVDDEVIETCHVELTSVPVFGNALTTGLAVSLGVLGYLGARRRM